jgi:hypothetical protein
MSTISDAAKIKLNKMNRAAQDVSLGTIIQGLQVMNPDVASGTIKSKVYFAPAASAAIAGINYHKLFAIGDVTGTTAYGFGDPTKPTTGFMACFGRTVIASEAITDTAIDGRAINRLVNTGANTLQAGYFKAKNYSTGTVGTIKGLFVEAVNEGTATLVLGIDIGSDGTVPNADIRFTNGAYLVALATAITANSTATTAPAGSLGFTTHATGVGKWYVSDGSKWQYFAIS